MYQNLVQNNVSETDTKKCIENWYTDKEDIEKKDEKKKDVLNKKCIYKIECKVEKEEGLTVDDFDYTSMEGLMQYINETLTGETEDDLINQKGVIMGEFSKNRIPMGTSLYNRASSYLNRKYQEKLELVTAEAQ